MRSFSEHVALVSYGDDNLLGVSNTTDWFNQVAITEGYKLLDMVYTMESKTGEIIPFRDISEVSFLMRMFRRDEDLTWVAPLDLESIFNPLLWVRKGKDSEGSVEAAIYLALQELALHGRETWAEYAPLILKESERKHYKLPNVTTFLQLLFLVSGREARY